MQRKNAVIFRLPTEIQARKIHLRFEDCKGARGHGLRKFDDILWASIILHVESVIRSALVPLLITAHIFSLSSGPLFHAVPSLNVFALEMGLLIKVIIAASQKTFSF